MPERPYIDLYVARLNAIVAGQTLLRTRVQGPSLLQTVEPPLAAFVGRPLLSAERLNKRVVLVFSEDYLLVIHLMIAGRLLWTSKLDTLPNKKVGLLALGFTSGTLLLNEYGTKRRSTLSAVIGRASLGEFARDGVEVTRDGADAFVAAIRSERRTLKRALADPKLISGIGNAWSDEILHEAALSPTALTTSLNEEDLRRLHRIAAQNLEEWTQRLAREAGDGFPERVTAFHPDMRVHGRYGQPCRVCGTKIQRIRFADNEANYCPRCQTDGKLLSDRSLARLLHDDWPKTIDALEARRHS